jgi:hypothetical protein
MSFSWFPLFPDGEIDPVLRWSIALGFSLLLSLSALHKFRTRPAFAASVAGYAILPLRSVAAVSVVIPVVELGLAFGLLWPAFQATALIGTAGLLALYAGALAFNLARGRRDIDCGCGGPMGARRIGVRLVVRNLFLVALSLVAAAPASTRVLSLMDLVTVVAVCAFSAVLYASLETLAANRERMEEAIASSRVERTAA